MTETLQGIGEWATRTFGPGDPKSCYLKLGEEFGELAEPIQRRNMDKAVREMADMVIVLAHMAASAGCDLQRAIDNKMEVNRARTWEITPEGTGKHVERTRGASPLPAPQGLTVKTSEGVSIPQACDPQPHTDEGNHLP